MIAGYLDTSFLLAILLREPRSTSLRKTLAKLDSLVSGDLLIAETLSALAGSECRSIQSLRRYAA